jgi:branched-chain amino acid aminotransferase
MLTGRQYFVCPVSQIHHRGRDVHIPMGPENQPNEITNKIKTAIGDIMYGRTQHEWGVVIPEEQ